MRILLPNAALATAMFIAVAGCATSGSASNPRIREARPPEIAARVQAAAWEERDVRAGNNLYALKCGRCHKFYDPAEYNNEDWAAWFDKMSRKTKLDPAQDQLLRRYLEGSRPRAIAP